MIIYNIGGKLFFFEFYLNVFYGFVQKKIAFLRIVKYISPYVINEQI